MSRRQLNHPSETGIAQSVEATTKPVDQRATVEAMATTLNPALIALIEKLGAALRPRPKKPNATEDERRAEVLTDDDGSGYAMTHDRRPARKRDGQRI